MKRFFCFQRHDNISLRWNMQRLWWCHQWVYLHIAATAVLKMSSTQLLSYRYLWLFLSWVSFWLLFIRRYVTFDFNHGPGQYRKSNINLADVGACPAVLYIIQLGKFGRCIYRLYWHSSEITIYNKPHTNMMSGKQVDAISAVLIVVQ